jgi:hypothetical protein
MGLVESEKCISAYVAGCSCSMWMLDEQLLYIDDVHSMELLSIYFVEMQGDTDMKILGAIVSVSSS